MRAAVLVLAGLGCVGAVAPLPADPRSWAAGPYASSTFAPGKYAASLAFDNNAGTFWYANQADSTAWLMYRFSAARTVSGYTLVLPFYAAGAAPAAWQMKCFFAASGPWNLPPGPGIVLPPSIAAWLPVSQQSGYTLAMWRSLARPDGNIEKYFAVQSPAKFEACALQVTKRIDPLTAIAELKFHP